MARANDLHDLGDGLKSMTTAAAELEYERSAAAMDILAKDEDIRKLRLSAIFLRDEIDEMSDKMFEEAERADEAELDAEGWQAKAEDANARYEMLAVDSQVRGREVETLRTELASYQTMSANSTKLLAEKLALTGDLANLQPELEHLRSQASIHQGLLSEKLALQEQLEIAQAELENATRKLQRAAATEGKLNEQDARFEAEIENLEKQLAKAKKEQIKAEKKLNAETSEQLRSLEKELDEERKDHDATRKRANAEALEQVKTLERELAKERRAREEAENAAIRDSVQVNTLKRVLEDEQRAREAVGNTAASNEENVQHIQTLKLELAHARQAQEEAEHARDANQEDVQQLQALRKEVAEEKKARERAEKTLAARSDVHEVLEDTQEQFSKELAMEREAREKAEKALASQSSAAKDQRKELETAQLQLTKSATEYEAEKAVMADKLDQFRSKLKSTKERLKEAEKRLQEPSVATKVAEKNPRKRPISHDAADPDATIGTPGDGAGGRATKRGKRASSVVGEKSTFSITPFLNRKASVAPEDLPLASVEESDASPIVERAKVSSKQSVTSKKALALASVGKSNAKAGGTRRQAAAAPSKLEQVAEEEESDNEVGAETVITTSTFNDENIPPATVNAGGKAIESLKPKLRFKASSNPTSNPKSLSSFASFREGSIPPQFHRQQSLSAGPQQQQKKKRKLVGPSATIFDEDEDDGVVNLAGGAAAKGFGGGQRAFGAFGLSRGLGMFGKAGTGGSKRGPLVVAKEDGFMFSPLKRNKRAGSVAME